MAEHDQSYKQLFSYPRMIEDLLSGIEYASVAQSDLCYAGIIRYNCRCSSCNCSYD